MNCKERILAAWNGQPADYVPLSTWCFGFPAAPQLRWRRGGREVTYWYSGRLEHIHTLPQPWTVEDDFRRVLAWRLLGVDDVLDVSVPWSTDPEVTHQDTRLPAGAPGGDLQYPVMVREYRTPEGRLSHAVRATGEYQGAGWVVQPGYVPLFEDYNIPRGVKHALGAPAEVPVIKYLYRAPDAEARAWFASRMESVHRFAEDEQVPVQAWSAFGMDGVVWLTGVQGAILMAMDEPAAFGQLVDLVAETDLARTELAAAHPGVDMVVERGWYSSTDFWSPRLFDAFVFPHLKELAAVAHRHGKRFGYTMTTGIKTLGRRLADAGVDVLYFVDPVQDRLPLEIARDLLSDRVTLVGGTNALTLASGDMRRIREEVCRAIEVLGPTRRFILQPVDALFPDTPWESVAQLIAAWKEYR